MGGISNRRGQLGRWVNVEMVSACFRDENDCVKNCMEYDVEDVRCREKKHEISKIA